MLSFIFNNMKSNYACPICGAKLDFDPNTDFHYCSNCNSRMDIKFSSYLENFLFFDTLHQLLMEPEFPHEDFKDYPKARVV